MDSTWITECWMYGRSWGSTAARYHRRRCPKMATVFDLRGYWNLVVICCESRWCTGKLRDTIDMPTILLAGSFFFFKVWVSKCIGFKVCHTAFCWSFGWKGPTQKKLPNMNMLVLLKQILKGHWKTWNLHCFGKFVCFVRVLDGLTSTYLIVFMQFYNKSYAGRDHLLALQVIVVGAHFPHPKFSPELSLHLGAKTLKEVEELGRHFQNLLHGAKIKTGV